MKTLIDWFAVHHVETKAECKELLKQHTRAHRISIDNVYLILQGVYAGETEKQELKKQLYLLVDFYRGGMSIKEIIKSLRAITEYKTNLF